MCGDIGPYYTVKIIGDIPDFNVLNVPKTQPRYNPAHGFVLLYFIMVLSFHSCDLFVNICQGYFTGTRAIIYWWYDCPSVSDIALIHKKSENL